jgi:hypothetical protein
MSDNVTRHLRMAHDAAQSAGITVTDWLNQAILKRTANAVVGCARASFRRTARAGTSAATHSTTAARPIADGGASADAVAIGATGTASQPAWRADTRRASPHPEPTPEHDAAVQDELDARLARIITATRAELAREESGDEPTVTVAENAPPRAPTGRRKGSPMLTGAMIVLLIAAAAAIWLIRTPRNLAGPGRRSAQQPGAAARNAAGAHRAPPPKVTDVTRQNPRASDPESGRSESGRPEGSRAKPGDTKASPIRGQSL